MPITPLFAAVFAVMYIFLSFSVIRHRLRKKIGIGDGSDSRTRTSIRVHGNFSEYVPFALILMWFIETITFKHSLALVLGCVLLLGRVLHVIGMNNPQKHLILRQIGMMATLAVMLVASAVLIWHYLPVTI